jgi:hypothetical protein
MGQEVAPVLGRVGLEWVRRRRGRAAPARRTTRPDLRRISWPSTGAFHATHPIAATIPIIIAKSTAWLGTCLIFSLPKPAAYPNYRRVTCLWPHVWCNPSD